MLVPVSVLERINRLHATYWRNTGLRPTRLYIGHAVYNHLREETQPFMWKLREYPSQPEQVMGLDIHIVCDDVNHLFVA